MTKKQTRTPALKKATSKKHTAKAKAKPRKSPAKVKVVGLLDHGAWHSGGKIPLDVEISVSEKDAKLLLSRKQVRKVT